MRLGDYKTVLYRQEEHKSMRSLRVGVMFSS
jgi:hypothetical protein